MFENLKKKNKQFLDGGRLIEICLSNTLINCFALMLFIQLRFEVKHSRPRIAEQIIIIASIIAFLSCSLKRHHKSHTKKETN